MWNFKPLMICQAKFQTSTCVCFSKLVLWWWYRDIATELDLHHSFYPQYLASVLNDKTVILFKGPPLPKSHFPWSSNESDNWGRKANFSSTTTCWVLEIAIIEHYLSKMDHISRPWWWLPVPQTALLGKWHETPQLAPDFLHLFRDHFPFFSRIIEGFLCTRTHSKAEMFKMRAPEIL